MDTGFQPNAQDRKALTPALSPDQWASVIQLFGPLSTSASSGNNSGKPPIPWILDTGASFHMTGLVGLLHDLVTIPSVRILLPDGTISTAT